MRLLKTRLCLLPKDHGPLPTRADVLDELLAREEADSYAVRIATHGAVQVALAELHWLHTVGAESLARPSVASTFTIRRPSSAPLFVTPLDVLRRFVANGWVSEEERSRLPAEALDPEGTPYVSVPALPPDVVGRS